MAAINAFLDELPRFVWQMSVARGRILSQFAADGSLPHEMTRRTQLHYMMFTLQGWYTLARIASNAGIDYWRFKREDDLSPPLKRGAVFTGMRCISRCCWSECGGVISWSLRCSALLQPRVAALSGDQHRHAADAPPVLRRPVALPAAR